MNKVISILLLLVVATAYARSYKTTSTPPAKKALRLSTGITMSYIERGNVGGKPVVLLHGLTDTSRSFEEVVEEMVSKYPHLRVIVPDLRGHGDSSMPSRNQCADAPETCFTPALMAEDVIALFDALELDAVYLVGHSMGSVVAQELALNHPDRVYNMVLIGTYVYGKDNSLFYDYLTIGLMEGSWKPMLETEPDFSWPLDAYTITPADFGREVTQRLRKEWVTEAGASESLLDAICSETVKIPLGTWIGTTTALSQVDNRKALEALTVPTLVLWGTHDMVFDKDEQERVMHALQEAARVNNTPVVFKTYGKTVRRARDPQRDLGHNLHWAAPAQVAADIISFVRTGFPNDVQVWLNPENPYEVMEMPGAAQINAWGANRVQASRHSR